jgi:alpha-glucosidase
VSRPKSQPNYVDITVSICHNPDDPIGQICSMSSPIDKQYYTSLRQVRDFRQTKSSVELKVDDALVRFDMLRDDVFRIKVTLTGVFDEKPTFAVVDGSSPAAADFEVVETDAHICVRTAKFNVVIGRAPFSIDAYRADGSAIFRSASDSNGCGAYSYLNDSFVVTRASRHEDSFLGLGEKTGRMNRNGRSFTMWNIDVLDPSASAEFTSSYEAGSARNDKTSTEFDPYYASVPFFIHVAAETSAAAGFFVDNGYRGFFDFESRSQHQFRFDGGEYTEYVFAGPSIRSILSAYTELTGRMQAPPIWALGYHQCRWKVYTQDAVLALAATLRDNGIPCDSLWLDIEYMDGYRVFTWDKTRFPNAARMFDQLAGAGVRVITIVDPGVKAEPGYAVYESGVESDAFCRTEDGNIYLGQVWPGKTAFPDFVTEDARAWWGRLNANHVENGAAGIWNDMNEPATGDIPPGSMRFDCGRQPHERYHNQYALLMAMATQEGLLSAKPDLRTFILSRAGSAGIQRFAANWLGDNMSRWDHLWLSVPMALGFGLSGQPFVGADIGGFGENTNGELFARWMQCAAFSPFCRNHNHIGQRDQYPWSFGVAIRDICRASLELRYRLMPTLYSAFIHASQTGIPIQRPLVLEYQDDVSARDIDDEFLLGDSLLVAPVLERGLTARQVYLPQGSWHHWHTGEVAIGPKFVLAPTPMDYIPVYAKGGAVVSMWPEAPPSTMGYQPSVIELHVFEPTEDGEFHSILHEDDGLTFAHREGRFYRTDLTVRRRGSALTLEGSTTGKGYPEFRREAFRVVLHRAGSAHGVSGDHDGAVCDSIHVRNSGESFRVDFGI